jgi:hypothetical protein
VYHLIPLYDQTQRLQIYLALVMEAIAYWDQLGTQAEVERFIGNAIVLWRKYGTESRKQKEVTDMTGKKLLEELKQPRIGPKKERKYHSLQSQKVAYPDSPQLYHVRTDGNATWTFYSLEVRVLMTTT